jgi:2-desacetyl-2-hydroxyethyl bacteriochlorophyllide A dehydrogenase
MQAAVFTGPQQIEIRNIGLPNPNPRQILVKVRAVGLCTWEQRFYRGTDSGSYPFRGGHEVAGEVVEVGPEAQIGVQPGDAVCLALSTRCGSCHNCRRGLENFCLYRNETGPGKIWGPAGLSEYVVAEADQVYRAGDGLPFEQLALAEPVACVLRSASLPPLAYGDWVIIQGVGPMGLLHVQLLKQRGAQVVVAEPDPERREVALELGADLALDPLAEDLVGAVRQQTGDLGARAVFFTAGGAPAIEQGLDALAVQGWLCLYGSVRPQATLAIDPNEIHYRELFLTGTFSHTRASFREAVQAISAGLVDLAPLVSARLPFSDLLPAFELAVQPDTYRVVVNFDE